MSLCSSVVSLPDGPAYVPLPISVVSQAVALCSYVESSLQHAFPDLPLCLSCSSLFSSFIRYLLKWLSWTVSVSVASQSVLFVRVLYPLLHTYPDLPSYLSCASTFQFEYFICLNGFLGRFLYQLFPRLSIFVRVFYPLQHAYPDLPSYLSFLLLSSFNTLSVKLYFLDSSYITCFPGCRSLLVCCIPSLLHAFPDLPSYLSCSSFLSSFNTLSVELAFLDGSYISCSPGCHSLFVCCILSLTCVPFPSFILHLSCSSLLSSFNTLFVDLAFFDGFYISFSPGCRSLFVCCILSPTCVPCPLPQHRPLFPAGSSSFQFYYVFWGHWLPLGRFILASCSPVCHSGHVLYRL